MRPDLTKPAKPEDEEARAVGLLSALIATANELGCQRLLFAALDWDNLFQSASPPGALPPSIARETMTRKAQQRWARNQKERRGALSLLRAVRAA